MIIIVGFAAYHEWDRLQQVITPASIFYRQKVIR